MLTLLEVSQQFNTYPNKVNRLMDKLPKKEKSLCIRTINHKKFITDKGIKYLNSVLGVSAETNIDETNKYISMLETELEIKNKQIESLLEQNKSLIIQNENNQKLLALEKGKTLLPKKTLFGHLFNRNE